MAAGGQAYLRLTAQNDTMNKTAFLLALVVATLILFAGCTSGNGASPDSDASNPRGAETGSASLDEGSTQVQVSQTVSGSENIAEQIQICEEMADWRRTDCLESLALNYEIPSLCYGDSQISCFTQMAIKFNKPQYCQMIPPRYSTGFQRYMYDDREECQALFE